MKLVKLKTNKQNMFIVSGTSLSTRTTFTVMAPEASSGCGAYWGETPLWEDREDIFFCCFCFYWLRAPCQLKVIVYKVLFYIFFIKHMYGEHRCMGNHGKMWSCIHLLLLGLNWCWIVIPTERERERERERVVKWIYVHYVYLLCMFVFLWRKKLARGNAKQKEAHLIASSLACLRVRQKKGKYKWFH